MILFSMPMQRGMCRSRLMLQIVCPTHPRLEDWETGVDSTGAAARHVIINAKLQNVCNTCGLLQKDRKRSAAHLGFAQTPPSLSLSRSSPRYGFKGGLLKNLAKSLSFYGRSLKAGNSFRL